MDSGNTTYPKERGNIMAANITRSVFTCKAFGLIVSVDAENKATVEPTEKVEFLSTKPTEAEAARALRNAGIKVSRDLVRFKIVSESVYAMTLDDFIAHATVVERGKGGYVRKSDMQAAESED
jgi:hypothetical protein